jgi:3-hydroxybutyryl-CoA dehydrogenase
MQRMLVVGAGTMGHGIAHVAAGRFGLAPWSLYDIVRGPARQSAASTSVRANVPDAGVDEGQDDRGRAGRRVARSPAHGGEVSVEGRRRVGRPDRRGRARADLAAQAAPVRARSRPRSRRRTRCSHEHVEPVDHRDRVGAPEDPERVIGAHFFNPVHLMPLLEIVAARHTSPMTWSRRPGRSASGSARTCIVVRDSPGFATSRLGCASAWRRSGCSKRASRAPKTSTRRWCSGTATRSGRCA